MEKERQRYRNSKKPRKEEFEYQYYELQTPAEKLAQLYNVKTGTIYNWASRFRKEEN